MVHSLGTHTHTLTKRTVSCAVCSRSSRSWTSTPLWTSLRSVFPSVSSARSRSGSPAGRTQPSPCWRTPNSCMQSLSLSTPPVWAWRLWWRHQSGGWASSNDSRLFSSCDCCARCACVPWWIFYRIVWYSWGWGGWGVKMVTGNPVSAIVTECWGEHGFVGDPFRHMVQWLRICWALQEQWVHWASKMLHPGKLDKAMWSLGVNSLCGLQFRQSSC